MATLGALEGILKHLAKRGFQDIHICRVQWYWKRCIELQSDYFERDQSVDS